MSSELLPAFLPGWRVLVSLISPVEKLVLKSLISYCFVLMDVFIYFTLLFNWRWLELHPVCESRPKIRKEYLGQTLANQHQRHSYY